MFALLYRAVLTETSRGDVRGLLGIGFAHYPHEMFGVDLLLERLACHQEGVVATAVRYEAGGLKAVVVALDAHGGKDHGFGEDGLLALSTLIPESSSHALDGIAVISPAAGVQRIVISTTLRRGPDWYGVTSGLSLAGVLDDAFGEGGHHWSDAWILNNGFSIEDSSKRITLCTTRKTTIAANRPSTGWIMKVGLLLSSIRAR